ncbi:MAG: UDP-3-O-acyl-N-acetylglucosamine deacetylase, partial [Nitrospirota bacterium]
RTFTLLRDVERLWSKGLAKGGSLENAVVVGDQEILNEGGLRYKDEFVRHKILDLIGDMSLLGSPIIGSIIATRSGHALNTRLVLEVLSKKDCWIWVNADNRVKPKNRSFSLTTPNFTD